MRTYVDLVEDVNALTKGDGFVSKFDLKNVCGLSEHDIKKLIDSQHLIRIKRGCYEFKYKVKTWNDVIRELSENSC